MEGAEGDRRGPLIRCSAKKVFACNLHMHRAKRQVPVLTTLSLSLAAPRPIQR